MDAFDRFILNELKGDSPRDFDDLLAKAGFSHNTLRLHLSKLESQGLIVKKKTPKRTRGRPQYRYSLPPQIKKRISLLIEAPQVTLITFTFKKLRQICKHNRNGHCRAIQRTCTNYTCPHITRHE